MGWHLYRIYTGRFADEPPKATFSPGDAGHVEAEKSQLGSASALMLAAELTNRIVQIDQAISETEVAWR